MARSVLYIMRVALTIQLKEHCVIFQHEDHFAFQIIFKSLCKTFENVNIHQSDENSRHTELIYETTSCRNKEAGSSGSETQIQMQTHIHVVMIICALKADCILMSVSHSSFLCCH